MEALIKKSTLIYVEGDKKNVGKTLDDTVEVVTKDIKKIRITSQMALNRNMW